MNDMELAEEIERRTKYMPECELEIDLPTSTWQQIIAALRRGPEPVHRECEQCGMLVACWSDAQIEEINRLAASLHAKIKPRIDAEASKEPK